MKKSVLENIKPEVRAIAGYHLNVTDCPVKLNQNESPFDVPEGLKAGILNAVGQQPWSRYPLPMPEDLVDALARHTGADPEGTVVCNGSNTLIQTILSVTAGPGVAVAIPSPTFSLYALYTEILGGRAVSVDLLPDYTFDVPAIGEAIRRERANVAFICSPNNPTGCRISNPELDALLSETDALIVVDEAYGEFCEGTSLDLLPRYPNLIVLKTFSKALGAAGIRIGYLTAHPDLAREVLKAKIPFDINVFSRTAALGLLKQQDLIRERVAFICAERDRVFDALRGIGGVRPYPSHANFILFEVADPGAVFAGLVDRGVLIRDVTGYPMLSKAFRVSVGTKEENDRFLNALKEALQEA